MADRDNLDRGSDLSNLTVPAREQSGDLSELTVSHAAEVARPSRRAVLAGIGLAALGAILGGKNEAFAGPGEPADEIGAAAANVEIPNFEVKPQKITAVAPSGPTTIVMPLSDDPLKAGPVLVLPLGEGWDLQPSYGQVGPDHLVFKARGKKGLGSIGMLDVQVYQLSGSFAEWETAFLGTFDSDGVMNKPGDIALALKDRGHEFTEKPKRPKDISLGRGLNGKLLRYSTKSTISTVATDDFVQEVYFQVGERIVRLAVVDYVGLDAKTVFSSIKVGTDEFPFEAAKGGRIYFSCVGRDWRTKTNFSFGGALAVPKEFDLVRAPRSALPSYEPVSTFSLVEETSEGRAKVRVLCGELAFHSKSVVEGNSLQDSLQRELKRIKETKDLQSFEVISQKGFKGVEGVYFSFVSGGDDGLKDNYVAICRGTGSGAASSPIEFLITLTVDQSKERTKISKKMFENLVKDVCGTLEIG